MTHNQHNRHQHTDAIYVGEVYLIRSAGDHTPGSTIAADAPTPYKRGSFRELGSCIWALLVPAVPKVILGIAALWVLGHLFG